MSYTIEYVKNNSQLKEFLNLSSKVWEGHSNPHYVRPLNQHMKMMLGSLSSKEKYVLMAKKNGVPVARMAAKTHTHGKKTSLNFGFFECIEGHSEAVKLLVDAIHSQHPNLDMMGPFHFRLEDPYVGNLVEGFDQDPFFLMPYNPAYYDDYLKSAGLDTAMDLFTYTVSRDNPLPKSIVDNAKECREKGFTIRTLKKNNLEKEARIIASIFNDALSKNWGYEEFLDEQVKEMVTLFRLFIDPRVVLIVEYQSRPVGCLIMIPDYNSIIRPSNGKVDLGLVWRFLRYKNKLNSLRGYALGVLKEFHGQGIASLICDEAWIQCVAAGYNQGEISWILANNGPMNELSKVLGGKHNKTYRIYQQSALAL